MDNFTKAYIECALWSSTDESAPEGVNSMDDNYSIDDFAPEAIASIEEGCKDFQQAYATLLAEAQTIRHAYDDEKAGHDFWLTRNGHGAGFWSRGLGEIGEKLTEAAKAYGSCNLYIGDTNRIHVFYDVRKEI